MTHVYLQWTSFTTHTPISYQGVIHVRLNARLKSTNSLEKSLEIIVGDYDTVGRIRKCLHNAVILQKGGSAWST